MSTPAYKPAPEDILTPPTVAADLEIHYGAANVKAGELAEEMNRAWKQGRRVVIEELLEHHPELRRQRDAVLRLVCEESYLRRENGLPLDIAEWGLRFPEWRQDVEALLECQKLLDPDTAAAQPRLLGRLHEFQLLATLGRGGQGQVYLATQPQLGDRPVVVKVTECRGREHLSLARLQHTHIVPLYWAQDYVEENQRLLCMPYFGSVTLGVLLAALQGIPLADRTGQHILDALDRLQPTVIPPAIPRGPARQFLANATYAQAIAWMGVCLADALAYAHRRELLHLDLKPSNVLWTTDGQPMLLDFHLARAPIHPDGPPVHGLGGTPGYMAPEQEAALNALSQKKPILEPVDARADIFGLGLLMHQALGGPMPFSLDKPPRLDELNAQVSPGLADIILRCLSRHAVLRYPDIESLGNDLMRHLEHRRLAGVPNRSWRERWNKWRRRQPGALRRFAWAALLGGVALGGAATAGWFWMQGRHDAEARITRAEKTLYQVKTELHKGRYDLALAALDGGEAFVPPGNETAELREAFGEQRRIALGQRARKLLHDGVNALRAAVVAETLAPEQLGLVNQKCKELWENRELLFADPTALDGPLRQDLIDLGVIWSEAQLRRSSAEGMKQTRRDMLQVLQELERRCGASVLLDQACFGHLMALGEETTARIYADRLATPQRLTAWEHVAQARLFLQQAHTPATLASEVAAPFLEANGLVILATVWSAGEPLRLAQAEWHAQRASAIEPNQYWASFYAGAAGYRQRRFADAAAAFRVCTALEPEQPIPAYNHGLAILEMGQPGQALVDFNRALTLDPHFGDAYLSRARAQVQRRDFAAAAVDLRLAREHGANPETVRQNLTALENIQRKE